MSEVREPARDDTRDGEILADLFDTLLQEILDGRTPDLASYLPDRPDLRERIEKTWALACSVAGRREPSRPVLGGYEILRELGHGGMGTVYLARHQALQREVAIKVLPHSLAMSPRAKQRFLEEARSLARLRHDNVVHIHRIIDHAEMLAFEMEFIEGPSLRTLVQELGQRQKPESIHTLADVFGVSADALRARNTTEWFVHLGIRVARALGEVHRHGLVHRDVKPSNILLRKDARPVLADFGLARDGDLRTTQAGFAGTPVYAAPERLRSGDADVDARADVYSLAVTLYEAITLGPSFGGSTTHDVLRHIEEGNLPSLRSRAPNVSRDLETVIAKAMEPDRRRRYATADEFADDLERLLSLQPIHARPAGPLRRTLKFLRRHQKIAIAAATGAVLVTAITWPVVAHARALDAARDQAAAAVLTARSRLLCPENLDSSWAAARSPQHLQTLGTPSARAAQVEAIDGALAAYDEAIALVPDENVALERSAVRLARELVADGNAEGEAPPRPVNQALPRLLGLFARRARAHDRLDGDARLPVADASAGDRFAAGLFAFLRHDRGSSQQCWSGLATTPADQAFLDACLALQMADDGQPERAYPRLFHAARALPQATALAFAITDAAIAIGDLDLARDWLERMPDRGNGTLQTRRQRLQADMLAARGEIDAARRAYRALIAVDPSSPEPLQRLAGLALAEGDHATATRLYRDLERRWPDLAQPRLQLARIALQRRDLPEYLDRVRSVLREDLRTRSAGAALQLASILRIGGLFDLHAEVMATLEQPPNPGRDDDALPLSSWLPPWRVLGIENALRFCAAFDRAAETANEDEKRPVAVAMHAAWASVVSQPRVLAVLPWTVGASIAFGVPPLVDRATEWITPLLLPFQRILGDRVHLIAQERVFAKRLDDMDCAFGLQVLRVGDTNGDTLPDLVVTAPPMGSNGGAGYLEIRSLDDGTLLDTWQQDTTETAFARSVATLGDVDGDLCDDIAIGAPINRAWSDASATVTLRSGRTGQVLWSISGEEPSFGSAIAALGDVDGDGVRDLVVGIAPMSLASDVRGEASIVSGKTGRILRTLRVERGGTWFGAAVANAGDGTGDGVDDVLVGGNYGSAAGLVALFDGRTGALVSTFVDEDPSVSFGFSVAGLPDVDGDGRADIVIGAPAVRSGGRQPGAVHVISSRTGKLLYEQRGDRGGDEFGFLIRTLPDWRNRREPAIAAAARRGGPSGGGYVRVFAAADATPLQSFAGTTNAPFCYSLVDLGDRNGDGYRDLGVAQIVQGGVVLSSLSFADILQRLRERR